MWKRLLAWILVTAILSGNSMQNVEAYCERQNVWMKEAESEPDQNALYAKSAVLMDADSGRILYENGQFEIGFDPKEIYAKANAVIGRMK